MRRPGLYRSRRLPHCGGENPAKSRFLIKGVLGFLIIVGGIAALVQFTGLLSPDEIYRRGNQPARLVPSVWHESLGFGPLFIIEKIAAREFPGQQIDWGSWAIQVRKADCTRIWEEVSLTPRANRERCESIMEEIEALPEDEAYLLVVTKQPWLFATVHGVCRG
jgi:hypothetical protein